MPRAYPYEPIARTGVDISANDASDTSRPLGPPPSCNSIRAKIAMSEAVDAIAPSAVAVSSQTAGATGSPSVHGMSSRKGSYPTAIRDRMSFVMAGSVDDIPSGSSTRRRTTSG